MSRVSYGVMVALVVMVMVQAEREEREYDVELFQRVNTTFERDAQLTSCYRRLVLSTPLGQGIRIVHRGVSNIDSYLLDIKSPVSMWNMRKFLNQIKEDEWEYYMTIIVIQTWKEAQMMLLLLYKKITTRTRYVILNVGNVNVTKICEYLWKWYLVNVVILSPNDMNLYTYFPYGDGECGTNIRPVVLGNCLEIPLDDTASALFPQKAPQVYNGCEIRVSTRSSEIIAHSYSEDARVVGPRHAMLNAIYKKMNLTKRPITRATIRNMSLSKNELYNSFNDIIKGRSELTTLILTTTSKNYDTSHVYAQTYSTWTVPIADRAPQWKAAIIIFDEPVWYFVIGMFCLNVAVWWLTSRVTEGELPQTLTECVFGSWLVLMNSSVSFPRSAAMRFVVSGWTVFCLIVIAAYQGLLLGFLLKPVYEQQIANEQQLAGSNLNITVSYTNLKTLNASGSQVDLQIAAKATCINSFEIILNRRYPRKNDAFILSNSEMIFRLGNLYLDDQDKPTRYAFKEVFIHQYFALIFPRGHPMLDQINKLLLRALSTGLVAKWTDDAARGSIRRVIVEPEDIPLAMEHLSCAFYVLVFGLLLAFFVLIGETIFHNISERNSD